MRSLSKSLFAIGLLSLPVLLPGCDVPVDFWQEQSVSVNYVNPDMTSISQEQDVDIGQNPAVAGKASLIKNVEIPEVWINVDKIYDDNNAGFVSGTMTITDPTDDTFNITLTYSHVPIAEGGKQDLTPNQDDIDKMQKLIQTKGKFHVKYSGSIEPKDGASSPVPAHFDLTGKIHIIAAVGS